MLLFFKVKIKLSVARMFIIDLSQSAPINDSFSSVTGPHSVLRPRGKRAWGGPKVLTPAPNILVIADL